ncbi:NADase-type glycan-binding domain-containing protein [Sediminitomix flava]|uniref:Intein n=1 Tax=Sediminitomix flava TaxID=379075 RepID=A0A315ZEG3_SEDFL|nr:hypothetical protein [Sediminitomix flava]PWJ43722.1 intein [Sediminitomix flava]
MRQITFLIFITLFSCKIYGQDIKNIHPTYVHALDFSASEKAKWKQRDTLLDQLSSGEKKWSDMTPQEQEIMQRFGEIYEDIWDIVGGACSWYCGGGPKEVTASSYLKSQGSNSYAPKNAHDLSYKTAWVEGVSGYGIGESLTYTFSAISPRITEIIVVNGYVKSEAAYKNNSRVKKLKLYINDKPHAILHLKDEIANQGFKFEPIGVSERDDFELLKTKADWTLKFEILEVYKGLKYDDVVISEIYFDGLDVHCFAAGTKIQLANSSVKNIEEIENGDMIAYMDFKTKTLKSAKVEKTEKVRHHNLVKYQFESGQSIIATQDHPFKLEEKGWASLKPSKSKQYKGFENIAKIKVGDTFITAEGTEKLTSIDLIKEEQVTYTISKLSSGDNFIANGFIVGVEELKNFNLQLSK